MPDRYRVSSRHPIDLASGASFAPGETAVGVNVTDDHDKQLIEAGTLVKIKPQKRATKTEKGSDNS